MFLSTRYLSYLLSFCASMIFSIPLWSQFTDPIILDRSDVFGGDGYAPGERTMDVADFDQDGLDDILLLGYQGPIWYKGSLTGFEAARQVGAREVSCVRDVRAGDLNGDGLPDIFTVDAQGTAMIWYRNLGSGEFSSTAMPVTSFIIDQCQHYSELADVDADGDLDVVIAWNFGVGIRWFRNNGTGVFSSELVVIETGDGRNGISDLVVNDIDGDGDQDVISANTNVVYDGLFVTLKGTNAFGTPVDILPVGLVAGGIAVGDLNGDGDKDIAFSSNAPESVRILLSNGAGGFVLSPLVLPGHFIGDLEMADVDGDGRLDLLSASLSSTTGRTIIHRNTSVGALSFEQLADIHHEESAHLQVWPDPLGTRIISREAASEAGAYIKVHQYDTGTGSWSSEYISPKVPRDALVAVDMNDDGALDMLGCDNIGSAVTLYSQGPEELEFSAEVLFTGPGKPFDLHPADFDGDGDQDIVVLSVLTGTNGTRGLFFVRNNGANGFAHDTLLVVSATGGADGFKVADLDADGDLDVCLSFYDDYQIRCFENDGNGSFTLSSENLSVDPTAISLVDFNLDGQIDILFTTFTQPFRWLRNDGALSFTLMPNSPSGPAGIKTADIDNDGDEDLYKFTGGSLNWWRRTGPLTFDPTITSPLPVSNTQKYLLDLDADGTLDLIGEQSGYSEWFRGLGDGTFESTARSIYVGVITTAIDGKPSLYADLDQDGDKEIALRVSFGTRQQPHLLLMENLAAIGTAVEELRPRSFSAVPNPFRDRTLLQLDGGITRHQVIQLCDLQGRVLRVLASSRNGQVVVERGGLANGLYMVRVMSAQGTVEEVVRLIAE